MLFDWQTWAVLFFMTVTYAYFTKEERDSLNRQLESSNEAYKEQKEYLYNLEKELDRYKELKQTQKNHPNKSPYQIHQYKDDIGILRNYYESEIKKLKEQINEMTALINNHSTPVDAPFLEWAYQNPDKLTYAEREIVLKIQSPLFMEWVKTQSPTKVDEIRHQMRGSFQKIKELASQYDADNEQNFAKLQELLASSDDNIMDWVKTLPQERQDEIMAIAENGDYDELQEIIEEYNYYLYNDDEYNNDGYKDDEYDNEYEITEPKNKPIKITLPFKIKEKTLQSINPDDFGGWTAEEIEEVIKQSCYKYLLNFDKEAIYVHHYRHSDYHNDVFGDFSAEKIQLECGRIIHEFVHWLLYDNSYIFDFVPYDEKYNYIFDELFGDYSDENIANGLQRYIESFMDCYIG